MKSDGVFEAGRQDGCRTSVLPWCYCDNRVRITSWGNDMGGAIAQSPMSATCMHALVLWSAYIHVRDPHACDGS